VTHVRVHHSVKVIAARAFAGCQKLVEVELCEGLEVIGGEAFRDCISLKRITIQSSVRSIGSLAFGGCEGLVEVKLCEGLEKIGDYAFFDCVSLRNIAIPPACRVVGVYAFEGCKSLRNIAIPPACRVGSGVFDRASALKKVFPFNARSTTISEALQHRFDELAIHQICYDQPQHHPNATMQLLKEVVGSAEQPNATGTQQDCLGMSPLHILTWSTKHDMDLYRFLIETYPNNLITQDKWGDLPILYTFCGNAPREVMQLLVESHKTYFPGHALDWGRMIITVGESNAPGGIRNLFDMHQNHFPDQDINWEECAVELARSQSASIETFKILLRLSVANRLDALGVEKWQGKVENFIHEFHASKNTREERARLLFSNLSSYEQMKEATWLLELALWKVKIYEYRSNTHDQGSEERNQCRINCGVQEILPIVVSFLSPKWESNPSGDDN